MAEKVSQDMMIMLIQQLCLATNRGQQITLSNLTRVVAQNFKKNLSEDEIEAIFNTDSDIRIVTKKGQRSAYLSSNLGRQTTANIKKRATKMCEAISDGLTMITTTDRKAAGPMIGETLRHAREQNQIKEREELRNEIQRIKDEGLRSEENNGIPEQIRITIMAN